MPREMDRTWRSLGLLAVAVVGLGCSRTAPIAAGDATKEERASSRESGSEFEDPLELAERSYPLLIWAAHLISKDYYDKSRIRPRRQLDSALEEIGSRFPEFFGERRGDSAVVTVRSARKDFSLGSIKDLKGMADLLERILDFAGATIGLEGEALHELEYAAINGFLAPLDPHTILLTPEETADLGVKTKGKFAGIGAEIRVESRRLLVVRVLPDSPAQAAGLLAGDLVLEIGGQSTVNMNLVGAQKLLRGVAGTRVELMVRRGSNRRSLEIERDVIRIASVRSMMLPGVMGYIQVSTFQEDTADKVEEAIGQLKKDAESKGSGLAGLVLDLRGNSGGLLVQATQLLDLLTTEGELVIVHTARGRESEVATAKLILGERVPVVAMIDEDTASAAEIVAGAIKHLDLGAVLGRASFGKGTVQMLSNAHPYGRKLALKMTVAEYRVAGDRQIQNVGVRPDLRIYPVRLSQYPGVANYYDTERFVRLRQMYQTAHLPSAVHDQGSDAFVINSPHRLRYLDAASETREGAAGASVEASDIALEDPEIRIAVELAAALAAVENVPRAREGALAALTKRVAIREDHRIEVAIGKWSVDWTRHEASTKGEEQAIEVTARIVEPGPFEAGSPFTLRIEVKNPGTKTLDRVHVVTDCEQTELDGIELLFGQLAPGVTATRDVSLHLMPWRGDSSDRILVTAHSGDPDSVADGEGEVHFTTVAAARPNFSFDYWVVDSASQARKAPKRPVSELFPETDSFEVRGNGDGVIQPGEQVLFAFRVHNEGPGEAPEFRTVLRNLSGAQGMLEEGVVPGGLLKVGASMSGAFGISVSEHANPELPLELELIAGDGRLRESVHSKIRLRVIPGLDGFEAQRSTVKVGRAGARLRAGADPSMAVVHELKEGHLLAVTGGSSGWWAVEIGEGRRLWLPKDLVTETSMNGVRLHESDIAVRMVDPPQIELLPSSLSIGGEALTVSGRLTHAKAVLDVVVRVRQGDGRGREHKAYYRANGGSSGDSSVDRRTMLFSSTIALDSGSNLITVVARDGDKVERRRDFRVRRR